MVGYTWQVESLVLGVEADINYLGFSDDSEKAGDDNPLFGPPFDDSFSHNLSFEADWFGTLRGRLGFAADNFLFYGTGGLAYGHLKADSDVRFYDDQTSDLVGRWQGSADDVNWGWTVGGGLEYGIDNWSLGAEYLYVDLGDADWKAGDDEDNFNTSFSSATVDYQFSVVRATLKYRF
jgi:outer membrane immunogenic protein